MARLLLGVSGGIAAYKALEVVRLATKAGHAVRVVQTPTAQKFVGAASFAALTGAPVLTDEFERDPARGAFPDQQPPDHDPASHLELVRNADAYLIAVGKAQPRRFVRVHPHRGRAVERMRIQRGRPAQYGIAAIDRPGGDAGQARRGGRTRSHPGAR